MKKALVGLLLVGLLMSGTTELVLADEIAMAEPVVIVEEEQHASTSSDSDYVIVNGELTEYKGTATDIVIPEGTLSIAESVFRGNDTIVSVTLPDSMVRISAYAFYECTNLSEINLPDRVAEIGECAFAGCESLTEIVLPKNMTILGTKAFAYCEALTAIELPKKITSATSLFYGCTTLPQITFAEGMTKIPSGLFYQQECLTEYEIPAEITAIGSLAFAESSLERIVIADSVTVMDSEVFKGCTSLTDVTWGTGVKMVPKDCFNGCTLLTSVELPYGVTGIGSKAFASCLSLSEITIPRSVTSISADAFSYPAMLTIYGANGTYAEQYAAEQEINFVPIHVPAERVFFDENVMTVSLEEGNRIKMSVNVLPYNFTDEIIWSSSNPPRAWIYEEGEVLLNETGSVYITATVGDKSATCKLVIVDANSENEERPGGVTAEQEEQIRAFVERMYTVVLNREADIVGLDDWALGLMERRVDGAEVVNGFVNSAEFAARGLSDAEFIQTLYLAVLNREADEDGLNDWMRAFAQGATRQDLIDGFVISAEFETLCDGYGIEAVITQEELVQDFVERMYTIVLERETDEKGLNDWVSGLLEHRVDGATVANGFVNSEEFVARGLSNAAYIDILYRAILNREAYGWEKYEWEIAMQFNRTRQDILDSFVASTEFRTLCDSYGIVPVFTQEMLVRSFVERMYTVALNREYDEDGLNDWVTGLMDGVINGAQVADGFIGSEEFVARGLSNEDYVKTLYQTFFDRTASKSEVSDWVSALTVYGQSRRDVLKGFVNSNEFALLCENYGIVRGEMQ